MNENEAGSPALTGGKVCAAVMGVPDCVMYFGNSCAKRQRGRGWETQLVGGGGLPVIVQVSEVISLSLILVKRNLSYFLPQNYDSVPLECSRQDIFAPHRGKH